MTFQNTQPAPLGHRGVGGVARSKFKSDGQPVGKLVFPTRICANCGTASVTPGMPGSGWIELILWMYIIPGLIYSIWRRSKKSTVCKACGSNNTVRLAPRAGKPLAAQHYPDGMELEEIQLATPAKTSPIVIIGCLFMLIYFFITISR